MTILRGAAGGGDEGRRATMTWRAGRRRALVWRTLAARRVAVRVLAAGLAFVPAMRNSRRCSPG
ncbi:MAG TPA: hypothetical protein VFQ68_24520 [Streptosporangiaceae bacterium]|nr:hypothetical protein [Streptosporangiaceae bacterium]